MDTELTEISRRRLYPNHLSVVLSRINDPENVSRYATHIENSSGENIFLCHGEYFTDYAEALTNYFERK